MAKFIFRGPLWQAQKNSCWLTMNSNIASDCLVANQPANLKLVHISLQTWIVTSNYLSVMDTRNVFHASVPYFQPTT